jgi:uncharacterized protein (TIGR02246 family)
MYQTIALAAMLAALPAGETAAQQTGSAAAAAEGIRPDEQAIRESAAAFARAFNAMDAKAVAALFTANAEIVDQAGRRVQGREAIQQVFAGVFQAHPKSQIKITVQSVHFLTPSLAMEDGTSTTEAADGLLERNRYTVVHVKQDGAWRMASARDLPDEKAAADEELEQLDWMIGEWVDESPAARINTSYRWADNHRAIVSEFVLHVGNRPAVHGWQRIGWDPREKKVHSWLFDSAGGFAEGMWTRSGNQWIVAMTGVTGDGETASATNVTTHAAKDRVTWQSRDRVVGDQLLPNTENIVIVRKAPEPGRAH